MPLALLAIGSVLDPEKFEVVLIDGRIEADVEALIRLHIEDTICFAATVITGSSIIDALEFSRKIKALNPRIPVIWGGWHTSLFAEQILADLLFVDICVLGQGEETFKELVDFIDKGISTSSVLGICYREDGVAVKNTLRPLMEMEKFDRINYDLINVETYFSKKVKRQFDYISSIGCLYRCAFCADPFVFGQNFKAKSAEKMGEEIEYYHKKYHFTDLSFQDDTFFTYSNRIEQFAMELIKRNIIISWSATMRADQGAALSGESWKLLKDAGLRKLLIGVESGSQEMMDHLKKDISLNQVYTCADRCSEFGISVDFPFIVGFPGESDESFNATIQVMKKLKRKSHLFQTQIFYFRPYPGSAIITELMGKTGTLPSSTIEWGNFDFDASGLWVSDEKHRYVEAFKFYLHIAYGTKSIALFPFRILAQLRCRFNQFQFPFEMMLYDIIRKWKKI